MGSRIAMSGRIRALMNEAKWRGFWGSMRAIKLNKFGSMHCFVDVDQFGNKYFEDPTETYGRHRWVEYAEDFGYDSSKVPPDWHKWLHHNSIKHPKDAPIPSPTFQAEFGRNPTGTDNAYFPDNHRLNKEFPGVAKEKYEAWNPGGSAKTTTEDKGKDVFDLK